MTVLHTANNRKNSCTSREPWKSNILSIMNIFFKTFKPSTVLSNEKERQIAPGLLNAFGVF